MQHRSSGSPLNVPNVSPTIQESQPQNEDDHLEINVSILNEVPAISSSNLKFKLFPETPFLALLLSLVIIYGVRFSIIRSEEIFNERKIHLGFSEGWVEGRYRDSCDPQWQTWRKNIPSLLIGFLVFVGISKLIQYSLSIAHISNVVLFNIRITFYNIISLIVLYYYHGNYLLFIYLIVSINFLISRIGYSIWTPILTWVFNFSLLIAIYYYNPTFSSLIPFLGFLDKTNEVLRWTVYYKILMLRLIAYNMDYYWKLKQDKKGKESLSLIAPEKEEFQFTYKFNIVDYSYWNYLAYCFYMPLYIAGPLIGFNAFVAQIYQPQKTYSVRYSFFLLVQVLGYMLLLDYGLHYIYYYNFSEYNVWIGFSGVETLITSFWVIIFMYMKFLCIWRFFRVISLLDGIEVPENMVRCVCNNFTFTGFWRSWHASFNKWTVRYLYIPLGGRDTQIFTIWIIFFFIGVWHDLWWRWVAWALLNCVFFSLEILFKHFVKVKFPYLSSHPQYRFLVAIAGTFDIYLLFIANLAIGYGFDRTPKFLYQAFISDGQGIKTFVIGSISLFIAVLLMQEIRRYESFKNKN